MEIDRPPPGEELSFAGAPSVPRQAASIILLRGGDSDLEVLLVRRTPHARFMGGVWVFPGGAVDTDERAGDAGHRVAAVRELREETGITLSDPAMLVKFSQWITPPEIVTRFDTHFFLAHAPAGQQAAVDGDEIVDHGWFTPGSALEARERGEIALVFPTIKHLEQLARFANAAELLAHARDRDVRPVVPHVVRDGEVARIVLPDDPSHPG